MKKPTGSLNEPDGVICFIVQAANGLENSLLDALQIKTGRKREMRHHLDFGLRIADCGISFGQFFQSSVAAFL